MRFNARRASRQRKMEARHDRARRRAYIGASRAGRAARSSATASRPLRFRRHARFASRRAAKAGASPGEKQAHPSNESPQDESSRGQTSHHSALNDSALFASLPFALRVGSMMDERAQAADNPPSPTSPAMKGPKSEDSGASLSAGAKAATVGRLIGERAFHLGASTTSFMPQADLKGESVLAAGFARDEAVAANPLPGAVPAIANATASAPIAPRAGAHQSNRASRTRAAAHEAARSGQKPEGSAPPAVVRAPSPPRARRPAESSAKTADGPRLIRPSSRSAANRADEPVWRAAPGAFRRRRVVPARRLADEHRDADACAPRKRAWRRLRVFGSAGQGDRRRSLAGRPRERLDDDAA